MVMAKPSKALEGRRVRLIACNDRLNKLTPGMIGTVHMVDDAGILHVNWEDGNTLGLCWDDGDRWTVLTA
jgi:uncharacterized protein DUF4314